MLPRQQLESIIREVFETIQLTVINSVFIGYHIGFNSDHGWLRANYKDQDFSVFLEVDHGKLRIGHMGQSVDLSDPECFKQAVPIVYEELSWNAAGPGRMIEFYEGLMGE